MNLVMAHLAEHEFNIAAPYHGIRTVHSVLLRDLKPGRIGNWNIFPNRRNLPGG